MDFPHGLWKIGKGAQVRGFLWNLGTFACEGDEATQGGEAVDIVPRVVEKSDYKPRRWPVRVWLETDKGRGNVRLYAGVHDEIVFIGYLDIDAHGSFYLNKDGGHIELFKHLDKTGRR